MWQTAMEKWEKDVVLVPWHTTNQVSLPDIGPRTVVSRSICATSSDIADGGDAKQLARTSTNDDHTLICGQKTSENKSSDKQDLGLSLRGAMISSVGHGFEKKSFIPVDDLDRIINTQAHSELKRLRVTNPKRYAHLICDRHEGRSPQDGKTTMTSRRRLFAILALINLTVDITEVIREDIYDWDLPLELDTSHPGFPELTRKAPEGTFLPVAFSKKWHPFQKEAFFRCQWQLSSPYFELRSSTDSKLNRYQLDPNVILPITTVGDPHTDRKGGSANVFKIQIHPAHRNQLSPGSEPWLALKSFRQGREKQFKTEVRTLKRLRIDHPHIIPLLATYECGPEYCLLLPWADGGNMADFFKFYPQVDSPSRGVSLSKWFASQLAGLSEALSSIHNCELSSLSVNASSIEAGETGKIYGVHGDLKPENILWFKGNDTRDENYGLGTFKLADFGLTSFHGLDSRSKFKPPGYSRTYQAPEYDMKSHVNQKYDMWSLGCVWTEMITWYLLGGGAVEAFKKERLESTVPGFKEDIFFSLPRHPDYSDEGLATKKQSVRKHFDMLRNLSGCTCFLSKLIEFVDWSLLRMRPDYRCPISELLRFTSSMSQKCYEDSKFCLEAIPPLEIRQGTGLSELRSHHTTHRLSIPVGSTESQAIMTDVNIVGPNITVSGGKESPESSFIVDPGKLNLPIKSWNRRRSISTVGEVETPMTSQSHNEESDQQRACAATTSTSDDVEEIGCGQSSKAVHSTPARQIDDRSLNRGKSNSILAGDDRSIQGGTYKMSESCFGISRMKTAVSRKWSALRRR
ncbi:kinase-like domain-containing protein [Xylariaceae sp. FL1019]|nr:kinase-like domain-containing protein [Xylariaceae sp. FL1019]